MGSCNIFWHITKCQHAPPPWLIPNPVQLSIQSRKKSLRTWFGEFCSLCCLPLLSQLACCILPTTSSVIAKFTMKALPQVDGSVCIKGAKFRILSQGWYYSRIRSPGNEFDNFEDSIFTHTGKGARRGSAIRSAGEGASKLDPPQMREFCPVRFFPFIGAAAHVRWAISNSYRTTGIPVIPSVK